MSEYTTIDDHTTPYTRVFDASRPVEATKETQVKLFAQRVFANYKAECALFEMITGYKAPRLRDLDRS